MTIGSAIVLCMLGAIIAVAIVSVFMDDGEI
jgi:hypothetical protein